MIPSWRSLLFVAADDEARVAKVTERGADAIILDLEDAVSPTRKAAARAALPAAIARLQVEGVPAIVRINSAWRDAMADIEAAIRPGLVAILVPKVEDAGRLSVIAEMVAETCAVAGVAAAPGLIALIESSTGIAALDKIVEAKQLIGLAFGTEDFALSMGVPPTPDLLDLPARLLALAAARVGIMALGLPVSIATIDDESGWSRAVAHGKAFGMTGALCIHPRQIPSVNDGFAISEAELAAARHVIDAWQAAGNCGAIRLEGKMVDLPVLLAARRVVAKARGGLA